MLIDLTLIKKTQEMIDAQVKRNLNPYKRNRYICDCGESVNVRYRFSHQRSYAHKKAIIEIERNN